MAKVIQPLITAKMFLNARFYAKGKRPFSLLYLKRDSRALDILVVFKMVILGDQDKQII